MLYFARWKAVAILLTALIVCALGVPNFISPDTVKKWPGWAQRYVVLGLDLQGGSHILLEVDVNDVRKQRLDSLRDEARKVLRDARIIWANPPVVRGTSVEVRLREGADYQNALSKLRELSQPITNSLVGVTGQRTLDVTDVGGGLVRLTPTEAATTDRIRQTVEQSIPIIEKRVNELGLVEPTVQRQGVDRILVQVPGLGDPRRLIELVGKTAKLEFRLVDQTVNPQEALQGRAPADSEVLYEGKGEQKIPILVHKQVMVEGADLTDAQATFDQRTSEPVVSFRFNATGARKFGQITQENVGRPFAIVLDNEVISAPVIREPILGGSGQISGSFTVQSANDLAILLRAGALPAKLTPIEQRVVGPGPRPGFHQQGKIRLHRRGYPGHPVHACDLRTVRIVRQHRGCDQCGHDLRHLVAAQRDADAPGYRRHRAHRGHRGRFQRADLRAYPRRGSRRPQRHRGDRRRVQPCARHHSRLRTSPPSSQQPCCSSSAPVRCAASR